MKLKDNQLRNSLAALRAERGLTQEEVARELNVTRQTVSKWERGLMAPDTVNLAALGRLYGVSLDELVNGPPPQEEPVPAEEAPPEAPLEGPPAPRQSVPRKRVWAAVLAGCILLAGMTVGLAIGVAVSKELEKPGIIWTDDITPEYIDLTKVVDMTDETTNIVP